MHRNFPVSAFQQLFLRSRATLCISRRFNHGALQKTIQGSIKASGPIPVSTYMQMCLSHPTEGYYMKQRSEGTDVFGVRGDFTTSPEISQVFGELVCLWFLSIWRYQQGSKMPKNRLVELGPGRGTLMHDFIRTLQMFPDSKKALTTVHLVETSPVMRSCQAESLAAYAGKVFWYDSIEDLPEAAEDEFTMIVAHEFFDALPINIIKKTQMGFKEVLVDLNPDPPSANKAPHLPFRFVVSNELSPRSDFLGKLSPRFNKLPEGSRVEISSAAWKFSRKIGEMISGPRKSSRSEEEGSKNPIRGAALIIDYGDEYASPSSFRAFKNHRQVDVFQDPGDSDLTANVDFGLLQEALQDIANTYGPLDQRKFLLRMGIMQRIAALVHNTKDDNRREAIQSAGLRLIDRAGQGMGRVYKMLGVTSCTGDEKLEVWPFVSLPDENI